MQTWQNKFIRWQQIIFISALTLVMLLIMLFALNRTTNALRVASGAFGCGDFDTAVSIIPEGKTIVPMIPPRPSNGAVIDKDLTIQGGWTRDGTGNCDNANQQVTGTQGLVISGFTSLAPNVRSILQHNGNDNSVITIDPQVESLLIEHMVFEHTTKQAQFGGGISGSLNQNGATIRLNNVVISNSGALQNGGGLYMSLQNGSHLEILNSRIYNNSANNGGGFEIEVDGNSHLVIKNTEVTTNTAVSGNGGGGRIIISSGFVTITNGTFSGNSAGGSGNGLSIEKTGSAPATVTLINTITDGPVHQTGSGSNLTVITLNKQVYLPVVIKPRDPAAFHAEITGITINNDYKYEVSFTTDNFTPNISSTHVHFFFNTVPVGQAGKPGSGPWKVYGSTLPFTGYGPPDKPVLATEMCILVANAQHEITPGSGNCYPLPQ
ncbi:MAG: hypothetical protein KC421_13865 [Anaerolineales bacterium]|nr:hypothetical protein [Anaerolineales bacterium]